MEMDCTTLRRLEISLTPGTLERIGWIIWETGWINNVNRCFGHQLLGQSAITAFEEMQEAQLPAGWGRIIALFFGFFCCSKRRGILVTHQCGQTKGILSGMTLDHALTDGFRLSTIDVLSQKEGVMY